MADRFIDLGVVHFAGDGPFATAALGQLLGPGGVVIVLRAARVAVRG